MDFFWFDLFLEARVENFKNISLVFWLKQWHQKDISKLTDLYREWIERLEGAFKIWILVLPSKYNLDQKTKRTKKQLFAAKSCFFVLLKKYNESAKNLNCNKKHICIWQNSKKSKTMKPSLGSIVFLKQSCAKWFQWGFNIMWLLRISFDKFNF